MPARRDGAGLHPRSTRLAWLTVAAGQPFDAEPAPAVLERHDVESVVVVVGYAVRLHGAARPTSDVDVAPRSTPGNFDRLASALRELTSRPLECSRV
jgi:hypothetical protein